MVARLAGYIIAVSCIVSPIAAAPVDDAQIRSAGIRQLTSRHLVLYTDVPADAEVDRLPAQFDAAVPQWAEYFGVDRAKTAGWQARAFLIRERRRFDALGLMPPGNDQFVNGISMGSDLWLFDQPTPYYRRHLLLHEGTHAFMVRFLGGCGPGWYMEGTAELMATHRLDSVGKPVLRSMPRNRKEVPMLGRIKLVRDAFVDGRALGLPAVMRIDNRKQLGNEAYAWCWAACKFLDSHPRYAARFRELQGHVLDREFNEVFRSEYAADWPNVLAEWDAFVATLDHGYDFERMAIDFRPGQPLRGRESKSTIVADRGWQSLGVELEAGRTYRITASGRYQIAEEKTGSGTTPWPCEPGGVTLEYHDGRPLGMLLGAIVTPVGSNSKEAAAVPPLATQSSFAAPVSIGLGCTIKPAATGTLYVRVNDRAAHLDDNRGTLTVLVKTASD